VPRYRPSLPSLLRRSLVLLGLILEAALLYLRAVLVGRGWLRTSPERLNAGYTRFARRFVAVATRYRAGLIKLGQLASLRFDVLPEEISQELARLQDRVPPHDYGEIATQIEHELGRPPEACFRRFERQPVAAASLGQVHVAWNERGEKLAVKILYPGIERSVAVDLRMTRLALWLFDFVSVADLGQVYRQISDSIHGEMDYLREGRAAEEVAENLARDPALFARLRIPKIHWETTTRRVLTMEFVEGQKIVDTLASAERAKEREEAVQVATRAFLHMIFKDGFFHCDPHPGNLLLDDEGRVGIIDFGMNQRIEPAALEALRQNVLASVSRDPELYAQSLVDGGMIQPRDVPAVKEMAELAFDPRYFDLTPKEWMEIDIGDYARAMRSRMKEIGSFQLPDGLVMWSRAFSLLYGLHSELAPGIRPLELIGPYVAEFLQGRPATAEDASRG
jgi:predicted unusual protein kinase regulating ubiquinone biosynthesis (AarF/ABC1/UbiB family)